MWKSVCKYEIQMMSKSWPLDTKVQKIKLLIISYKSLWVLVIKIVWFCYQYLFMEICNKIETEAEDCNSIKKFINYYYYYWSQFNSYLSQSHRKVKSLFFNSKMLNISFYDSYVTIISSLRNCSINNFF